MGIVCSKGSEPDNNIILHKIDSIRPKEIICPLCLELKTNHIKICIEDHTNICTECVVNYVIEKINAGYNGYCPFISCPICQSNKLTRCIKYKVICELDRCEPYIKKYENFAHSLTTIKCSGCHNQNSILPGYTDDKSSLTQSLINDIVNYENGFITVQKFYDKITSLHFPHGDLNEKIAMIVSKIQNPERRLSLMLNYFKVSNIIITSCCRRLHCFKCKNAVGYSSHVCETISNDDCVECPSCEIILTKADGCGTITCVCSYQFSWNDELEKMRSLNKVISTYEKYSKLTLNPMPIYDYYADALLSNKLPVSVVILKRWIKKNVQQEQNFYKSVRQNIIKTEAVYYIHIYAKKCVSLSSEVIDMCNSCLTSNEKQLANILILKQSRDNNISKYSYLENNVTDIHSIISQEMCDKETYDEIMKLFVKNKTRDEYDSYLNELVINKGIQFLYFNWNKKVSNISFASCVSTKNVIFDNNLTENNIINVMFISNGSSFVIDLIIGSIKMQISSKHNIIKCDGTPASYEFKNGDILRMYINMNTRILRIIVNEHVMKHINLNKKCSSISYNINNTKSLTKLEYNKSVHNNFENFKQFCMYLRLLRKIKNEKKIEHTFGVQKNFQELYTEKELLDILGDVDKAINDLSYFNNLKFTYGDIVILTKLLYENMKKIYMENQHKRVLKFVELYGDDSMYTALLINHDLMKIDSDTKKSAKAFIKANKDLALHFYLEDASNREPIFNVKNECKCIPRHLKNDVCCTK
jgi:hypothetical protein